MVSMGAGRATSQGRSASLAPDDANFDVCNDRAIHWRSHESSTEHLAPMELTLCLVPSRAWCQVDKASKLSGHDSDTQRLYLRESRDTQREGRREREKIPPAQGIHRETEGHREREGRKS